MSLIKQSSTEFPLVFLLIQSSDHITGLTGASPTVKLGKAGGAGAAPSGAVSEIDSTNLPGWYKVAANATDTNTLGPLVLHATAASADPVDILYEVVAFDAQDAQRLGLAALPSSSTLAVNPTINVTQAFNNTGQTTNLPVATILNSDVNAGGNTSSTLNLANSASPLVGAYVGCVVVSGGQARRIVGYTGSASFTAQVAPNWQTTPSNGAAYFVIADSRSDLGTVLGTAPTTTTLGVLDVNVKNINNVAAATPGAAGGVVIAGSNAATTFATLTSTGAFSINGTGTVAQSGDSFARIGANGASLTAIGDARMANLDVAVSTRMATYTQPTGFLAATFPATLASPTNITAGTITTVTNLTNLPAITANWITAAGITASALNGKGDWSTPANVTSAQTAIISHGDANWTGGGGGGSSIVVQGNTSFLNAR